MLRDLSNHVNVNDSDSDSDSGEDLPVVNFNLTQTVDALTLPADWEPMDINGVGTQLSGKPISTYDFQQYYMQRSRFILTPRPPPELNRNACGKLTFG